MLSYQTVPLPLSCKSTHGEQRYVCGIRQLFIGYIQSHPSRNFFSDASSQAYQDVRNAFAGTLACQGRVGSDVPNQVIACYRECVFQQLGKATSEIANFVAFPDQETASFGYFNSAQIWRRLFK